MARAGASLPKQPYLVLEDFDGPGTYLVVDVKTLDAAGPTRIATHHTCGRSTSLRVACSSSL